MVGGRGVGPGRSALSIVTGGPVSVVVRASPSPRPHHPPLLLPLHRHPIQLPQRHVMRLVPLRHCRHRARRPALLGATASPAMGGPASLPLLAAQTWVGRATPLCASVTPAAGHAPLPRRLGGRTHAAHSTHRPRVGRRRGSGQDRRTSPRSATWNEAPMRPPRLPPASGSAAAGRMKSCPTEPGPLRLLERSEIRRRRTPSPALHSRPIHAIIRPSALWQTSRGIANIIYNLFTEPVRTPAAPACVIHAR
jgi:hypothetical protein